MVSTMKKSIILLVAALATLSGCKKNDWLDWKAMNELWLEQNKTTAILPFGGEGKTYTVRTTETGLQYIVIDDPTPTEARPNSNSYINCNYTLDLISTIDNRSYHLDQQKSAYFYVSDVVPGFAEGIRQIHNHGRVLLYVPYELGYGTDGRGSDGGSAHIPPYSTLIFDITLNSID